MSKPEFITPLQLVKMVEVYGVKEEPMIWEEHWELDLMGTGL